LKRKPEIFSSRLPNSFVESFKNKCVIEYGHMHDSMKLMKRTLRISMKKRRI
jgi:hypothetical protein